MSQATSTSTASISSPSEAVVPMGWLDSFKVYAEPASLRMLALGFSAGLPIILVLGTLSFWLREAGIDRSTIGYLSWIGLAYGFKWCWSPLVDRLAIPGLTALMGRRRSWLLLSQLAIIGGLVGMAFTDPKVQLMPIVWCALVVAFASATQDIALDAFRIESADAQRQAALAATYQTGYRIAMIWAGAGVLWLAARAEVSNAANYQHDAWRFAYLVMAASMLVGVVTVLFSAEPAARGSQAEDAADSATLSANIARDGVPLAGAFVGATLLLWMATALLALVSYLIIGTAVVDPLGPFNAVQTSLSAGDVLPVWAVGLLSYCSIGALWGLAVWACTRSTRQVRLPGATVPFAVWFTKAFIRPFADFLQRYQWQAVSILALIALYRISDIVMGIMANPFYVDMGYSKDEVAAITKVFGVIMTLVGAFIGGIISMRVGVMRVLMLGAVLSAASNLLFAWLGTQGHNVAALTWVISADNLSAGIASAAFIAYLSSLTNVKYSATQYALFSSMMVLLPKFVAGFSGKFVDAYGYSSFFTGTALLGLPVLVLIALAARKKT
jgi:MFS transporter, PAT family, beta-lactamase induction signal transducer AmpG